VGRENRKGREIFRDGGECSRPRAVAYARPQKKKNSKEKVEVGSVKTPSRASWTGKKKKKEGQRGTALPLSCAELSQNGRELKRYIYTNAWRVVYPDERRNVNSEGKTQGISSRRSLVADRRKENERLLPATCLKSPDRYRPETGRLDRSIGGRQNWSRSRSSGWERTVATQRGLGIKKNGAHRWTREVSEVFACKGFAWPWRCRSQRKRNQCFRAAKRVPGSSRLKKKRGIRVTLWGRIGHLNTPLACPKKRKGKRGTS